MELNKIYNMDCMEGLKRLADSSIDVIFTSPPYNKAGYEGFLRKRHAGDSWRRRNIEYGGVAEMDFMPEDEYQQWQVEVLNECHRVLKEDGSLFYNHKVRVAKHKASHPLEWCLKSNLTFRQEIIWDRGRGPAVAPIRFVPTTELILWFTKSPRQPNFYRDKDAKHKTEVLRISPIVDDKHPASFPCELVDAFLQNVDNRNGTAIVLDPFMGSGTTAVSAIKNGFCFIGFEKDSGYARLSQERVLREFYDSGKWIAAITPEECPVCRELYSGRHDDYEALTAEEKEHLAQIAATCG